MEKRKCNRPSHHSSAFWNWHSYLSLFVMQNASSTKKETKLMESTELVLRTLSVCWWCSNSDWMILWLEESAMLYIDRENAWVFAFPKKLFVRVWQAAYLTSIPSFETRNLLKRHRAINFSGFRSYRCRENSYKPIKPNCHISQYIPISLEIKVGRWLRSGKHLQWLGDIRFFSLTFFTAHFTVVWFPSTNVPILR